MDTDPLTFAKRVLGSLPPEELLRSGMRPRPSSVARGEARSAGETALREGRVGVIMLAGGLATRMGAAHRLGLPIGPVTDRTLLELQLHKIAAVTTSYGTTIPVVLVTSEATKACTERLLVQYRFGGMNPDHFRMAVQPCLPVLDADGAPARDEVGAPIVAPGGHGSTLSALRDAQALDWLKSAGVDQVFCFQYPNAMEVLCDPDLIGTQELAKHDVTIKALPASDTGGRVGRLAVRASGGLHVVEYHRIEADPSLAWVTNNPVNAGTYVWRLTFLERCIADGITLPWRAVPHRPPNDDRELWKAEQFIFDLLAHADRAGFVLVRAADHYAIIKHRLGNDSLESAREALRHAYCRWLTAAGAVTDEADPNVEIDPRFALGSEDLAKKIEPGFRYSNGLVLLP